MLTLKQLVIDATATLGSPLLVCKAAPTYRYENGVPTNKRDGTRYTVAAPAAGLQLRSRSSVLRLWTWVARRLFR